MNFAPPLSSSLKLQCMQWNWKSDGRGAHMCLILISRLPYSTDSYFHHLVFVFVSSHLYLYFMTNIKVTNIKKIWSSTYLQNHKEESVHENALLIPYYSREAPQNARLIVIDEKLLQQPNENHITLIITNSEYLFSSGSNWPTNPISDVLTQQKYTGQKLYSFDQTHVIMGWPVHTGCFLHWASP